MDAVSAGWVVVDVETTGTDPQTCRMLSVAALALAPDGTVVGTLNTLLNPGVDPGPTDIHGLTPAALAGAPQFHHVSADLARVLRGRTLVAHHADFDYGFLAAEARRAGVKLPVDTLLCTVELADLLRLGLPNRKLATLARHYRVDQSHPHDALDDAVVLAAIFRRMLLDASGRVPLPIRPATDPASIHPSDEDTREAPRWQSTPQHPDPGGASPQPNSAAWSMTMSGSRIRPCASGSGRS